MAFGCWRGFFNIAKKKVKVGHLLWCSLLRPISQGTEVTSDPKIFPVLTPSGWPLNWKLPFGHRNALQLSDWLRASLGLGVVVSSLPLLGPSVVWLKFPEGEGQSNWLFQ